MSPRAILSADIENLVISRWQMKNDRKNPCLKKGDDLGPWIIVFLFFVLLGILVSVPSSSILSPLFP